MKPILYGIFGGILGCLVSCAVINTTVLASSYDKDGVINGFGACDAETIVSEGGIETEVLNCN